MHRGSSKGAAADAAAPETLPLSASPAFVSIEVVVERAAARRSVRVELPASARVRDALRLAGHAPEGSAVFVDGVSVPLDAPLPRDGRLTVVSTFSGG